MSSLPVAGVYPAQQVFPLSVPPPLTQTALDYITRAFLNLNVFQAGSPIPAFQAADALTRLNLMMGTWAQQLTASVITRDVLNPLTTGKGGVPNPYLWGLPGGDIATSKPSNQNGLLAAALILGNTTPPVEVPLAVLTDQQWAAIRIKNLQSTQPTAVYYTPTVPLGTVYLWPVPNNNIHGLAFYREQTFGPFVDLATTSYTFPDGYDEAIVYNLERRLAGPYGREMPTEDAVLARETFANIFRSNQRLSDLPNDLVWNQRRHGYNIQTGNL